MKNNFLKKQFQLAEGKIARLLIKAISKYKPIQNLIKNTPALHGSIGKLCTTKTAQNLFKQDSLAFKWYKRSHIFAFPPETVIINKNNPSDLLVVLDGSYSRPLPDNDPFVLAGYNNQLSDSESHDDMYHFSDRIPEDFKKEIKKTSPDVTVIACALKSEIEEHYRPL